MNRSGSSDVDIAIGTVSTEPPGVLLSQARMARGMEQREVARRLGLSLVLVRALEDNAFEQLGAPVFVRGYLSRYARLVGLDEQQILERYRQMGIDEPPPLRVGRSIKPQAKMTDTSVRWFSYLLILAVVGWLAWLGMQQVAQQSSEPVSRNGLPVPGDASGNAASTPATPIAPNQAAPAAHSATSPKPATQPPVVPALPSAPAQPSEPLAQVPATPEAAPAAGDVSKAKEPLADGSGANTQQELKPAAPSVPQLVLEFNEDCWVSIEDADGNRLAYGTMKAHTAQTFSGPAPFSLVLGNSGGVRIKLNDQEIDPAIYFRKGGVSRFVLDAPKNPE